MARVLLLDEQVRRNKRRTFYVMFLMGLMLAGMVLAVGVVLGLPIYVGAIIAVLASLLYVGITASASVSTVISASKARPANPNVREEKLLLYRVEEMSIASGLPLPKVYVQDSRDINAFAAGRNPNEAIICVTTGALQQLNQEELEGVLSHEMSHIKNYDVRLATITLGVVGAIALIAEIALRFMFYSRGGRGGGKGSGAATLIVFAVAIIFIILAPIFSRMAYFAMSRRREYLADSTGAMLTRNPGGLAAALNKIMHDAPDDPKGSRTVAGLYFANPYLRRHRDNIWSTHPPLEKRIERLTGQPYQPEMFPAPRRPAAELPETPR
ncbi:MAG TPA: M48 family metalloprotease [Candidatus Thermoplasmatota archaeon]